MKGRNFIQATLLVAALVLVGTGQAWAAPAIGTEADTTISNTASVTFTINSNTTSINSNTETFRIDRKIRPVVAYNGSGAVSVVLGASNMVLPFKVTNESNTKTGTDDYFYLQAFGGSGDNFDMDNVEIWSDDNGDGIINGADAQLTGDNLVVKIPNTSGNNVKYYLIVADTPATGPTAGQNAIYNLVATAWNGPTVADTDLDKDTNGNDKTTSEVVYADDASAGLPSGYTDTDKDGKHSDDGTYTVYSPIAVTKSAGNGTSGYHIPGDTVTYTVTVQNTDTTYGATGVVISDQLPSDVTFKTTTLTCSTGTKQYSADGNTWSGTETSPVAYVRCNNGSLAAAAAGPPVVPTSATMTFDVTIK